MSARDKTSARDDNAGGGGADDGFLSRWSRRKRETAAKENATREIATEPAPAEPDVADEKADAPATDAEASNVEAEPLVEPPLLDLIDKDFDLAHWLKQNVPESWKLAALRKTWETDPFIHGYLNPARDYALDWNVPGGAPGYGPLTESDDVQAMVAHVFGTPPPDGEDASGQNAAGSIRRSDNTKTADTADFAVQQERQKDAGLPPPSTVPEEFPELQPRHFETNADNPPVQLNVASQQSPEPAKEEAPSFARTKRRGGGATPV